MACLDRILRASDPGTAIDEIAAAVREILGPGELRLEWGRLKLGPAGDPRGGPWEIDSELAPPGSRCIGRMRWRSRPESAIPPPEPVEISLVCSVAAATLSRLLPEALDPASMPAGDTLLDELRERLRRAEQLALLGRLAADVAHEINNPLTSILGFAQLLSEDATGVPEANEHLAGLREQTLRCRRIASTLAAFSGRTEINLRPSDLETLVMDVALAVAARERAAGLHVVPIPAARDCWIEADRELLTEAVVNLIEGCVEERKLLGTGGRIEVRCRRDGEQVILEIQDDKNDGPRSRSASEAASVLLRITGGIIAMHRGRLDNKPDSNTRIRASFPASEGLPSLRLNELYRQWEPSGP
jgi:hypothetical protein